MSSTVETSKKIVKGALIVFISMMVGRLLSYIYVTLLAKTGSFNYGLLSLGFVISSILIVISMMGLNVGVVRYVAYYKGKGDEARIKGALLSSIKIALPISILLAFILFLFSEFISVNLFHNPDLTVILKILSFTIPVVVLINLILETLNGLQKIFYTTLSREVIDKALKIIFAFFIIYIGYSVVEISWSYLLATVLTFLATLYFLNKYGFNLFDKKTKAIYFTKRLFRFSYPLLFVGIITLLVKWTDVLMVGFFRTTSEVGVYNVVLSTANLLVIIPTALMGLFTPIIMELYSKGDKKEIEKISKRVSKWIFYINFPIFLALMLLSRELLKIVFGNEYVIGYISLIILLIAYVLHSLSHIPTGTLLMIKKTNTIFVVGLISVIINIALNYLLIPVYGINGAAIATSTSLIANFIFLTLWNYKLNKFQTLSLNYFKSILAGAILGVLFYFLIRPLFVINSIYQMAFFSFVLLLVYLLLLYLFGSWDQEDRIIMKAFLKRLKSLK
ncbi:MAG: flippase [Nanoarchaeota archaeon]|nr:flippase [Nanoarchaeota archaeon]